ncbi:MAG: hypothetical protein AB1726_11420 [Planctomycetota bacterium]
MEPTDFYNDRKYCQACRAYVPYLQSLEQSWCAICGSKVRLFSDDDWKSFHNSLKDRHKGGRPRRERRDKESA